MSYIINSPLRHPRHRKTSPKETQLYFYHSRLNQQEQASVLSEQTALILVTP